MNKNHRSPVARKAANRVALITACLCAGLWLEPASIVQAVNGRRVLPGQVPAAVARSMMTGRLPGTNHLRLAIVLPLRNREALTNLLRDLYDPASPQYHHYLTPEQFAERFGPTEQDYQKVADFAAASGFEVTTRHSNRLLLDVRGAVSDIERGLGVKMGVYQHPTEKRTFYAPSAKPSVPESLPIVGISGLSDYGLAKPRLTSTHLATEPGASLNTGSGTGGSYMGWDFRASYAPDTTMTGAGQTVGLLQFDGYYASDISYYVAKAGLPGVTLSNVLIDGATGSPSSGGQIEVCLDIETAISMAPNLSQVLVYIAPNPSPFVDILNRMATDNLAKQLSCSWYMPGGAAEPAADAIFQQMAAQGQSFFNASGDYDAYTGLIDFPGDTPYITQVGGTTLTTASAGGAWVSETVWNRNNGIGSGGGISTQYGIPSWQTNIDMTANQGSTTKRNTPDVALTAENVYVRAAASDYRVGGTSCAAPLWAGFMALANQRAAAFGRPAVGFVNPLVSAIGSSVNYNSTFHDITTGNNTSGSSPTKFYAVTGYDLCTGWGTPAGESLIEALGTPEPLLISPASGFSSIGGVGGPFTQTSQTFTLVNSGTNALTWSSGNTLPWLTVAPSGGALAATGTTATVSVSLNAAASNLVVGTYSGAVWFTNLNDGFAQSRSFALAVISPPSIVSQPTNQAALDGATVAFTVGAGGGMPLYYQWQFNSNNLSDGGHVFGSATTSLILSNVSSADVGSYSVVVSNAAGAVGSSNALLSITPSLPVITTHPRTRLWWWAAPRNSRWRRWAINHSPINGVSTEPIWLREPTRISR